MDINLEQYKLFYKVAKCESFSKAAEELFVSQPAVTQGIKRLEDNLGGALFNRTTNGIVLTEEGRNLYNFIEESIETLENAQERFEQYKNLEAGKIKIKGASTAINGIIEKPLFEFLNDYPNITIEMLSGGHKDTLTELAEGKIDLAALNFPISNEYKNLQIMEIDKKDLVFVMSKEYQEKNKVKVSTIKDLKKYDIIVPRKGTKFRDAFNKILPDDTKYKYEIMSESMQIEFAKKGKGIAFVLKNKIENELKSGELIEIDIDTKKAAMTMGIGVLNDDTISFATKKLVEYILKENS